MDKKEKERRRREEEERRRREEEELRLNNDEDKNGLKEKKILDLLYSIVKRFNMDLKYNKEKMHNNYKSNEIDFEKTFKDINYDILLKTYEEKFGNISKNIFNTSKKEKNDDDTDKENNKEKDKNKKNKDENESGEEGSNDDSDQDKIIYLY